MHGVRRAPPIVVAVACLLGAAGGCAAGNDDDDAARVAEDFYAAVAANDGRSACSQLSESTVSEIEKDEMAPCREAVTKLELSGSAVERSVVFVTSARVELRGGDHVFLEKTAGGMEGLGGRMQARARGGAARGLRGRVLMRVLFIACLAIVATGLAAYIVIGLLGH